MVVNWDIRESVGPQHDVNDTERAGFSQDGVDFPFTATGMMLCFGFRRKECFSFSSCTISEVG